MAAMRNTAQDEITYMRPVSNCAGCGDTKVSWSVYEGMKRFNREHELKGRKRYQVVYVADRGCGNLQGYHAYHIVDAIFCMGTGAIVVINEDTCMVDVARRLMRFFAHESCGHCTPCRTGTQRILSILERLEAGKGQLEDIDTLQRTADMIRGLTFCPMGDAASNPVLSSLKLFRDEYEYHVRHKRCAV